VIKQLTDGEIGITYCMYTSVLHFATSQLTEKKVSRETISLENKLIKKSNFHLKKLTFNQKILKK
jgi:hypothetical protein